MTEMAFQCDVKEDRTQEARLLYTSVLGNWWREGCSPSPDRDGGVVVDVANHIDHTRCETQSLHTHDEQLERDRSKGIAQVKPGQHQVLFALSRVRQDRLQNKVVFCTHPSKVRKPFCAGEKAEDSIAQDAMRFASSAEYNLYRVNWRQIGRQLRIDVVSPPLCMRITVACFHAEGTLVLRRQMLNRAVRMAPAGSTQRQLAYVMRSAPGADIFILESLWMISCGVNTSLRTSPASVFAESSNSHDGGGARGEPKCDTMSCSGMVQYTGGLSSSSRQMHSPGLLRYRRWNIAAFAALRDRPEARLVVSADGSWGTVSGFDSGGEGGPAPNADLLPRLLLHPAEG